MWRALPNVDADKATAAERDEPRRNVELTAPRDRSYLPSECAASTALRPVSPQRRQARHQDARAPLEVKGASPDA